jgi:hypothetical protein
MTEKALSAICYAVCAIGWIPLTSEEYYANPKRNKFDIEGTGFLVAQRRVQTCAHVIDALERMRKKRGRKPFTVGVHFVHPPRAGADADMSTSFKPFTVWHKNDEIDIAILDLGGSDVPVGPVVLVPEAYAPTVGEQIGLCGYAHGTTLLTRGGEVYRFGPVVQTGIIAALSPFDYVSPESAVLDLLTGPAASGSPVFRWDTHEVLGVLVEGQIKGSAALSITRLIYRDARGQFNVRASRVEMARVIPEIPPVDLRGPKRK